MVVTIYHQNGVVSIKFDENFKKLKSIEISVKIWYNTKCKTFCKYLWTVKKLFGGMNLRIIMRGECKKSLKKTSYEYQHLLHGVTQ